MPSDSAWATTKSLQVNLQHWAASELEEQICRGYNSIIQLHNLVNLHCKLLQPHPDAPQSPHSKETTITDNYSMTQETVKNQN